MRTTVDLWLCIDSAGDYRTGVDEATAKEQYEADIQPLADAYGFRLVKVSVSVPLPEPVELAAEVADDVPAAVLRRNEAARSTCNGMGRAETE